MHAVAANTSAAAQSMALPESTNRICALQMQTEHDVPRLKRISQLATCASLSLCRDPLNMHAISCTFPFLHFPLAGDEARHRQGVGH